MVAHGDLTVDDVGDDDDDDNNPHQQGFFTV